MRKLILKEFLAAFCKTLYRKWENNVEEYHMAVELGIISDRSYVKKKGKYEFDQSSHIHSFSQNVENEINYFIVGHNRFFSELLAK